MDHVGAGENLGAGADAAKPVIGGRPHGGVAERGLDQVRARAQGREQVLLGLIGVVQHPARKPHGIAKAFRFRPDDNRVR